MIIIRIMMIRIMIIAMIAKITIDKIIPSRPLGYDRV